MSDVEMNTDPLKNYGKNMQKFIKERLKSMVSGGMVDLQRDIRTNRFIAFDGGHHDSLIMRRSGHLSNSIRPQPTTEVSNGTFVGGLQMGKVYGRPLIGKRGNVTVITPKIKRFLAIPLPAALGNHGVVRGKPLDRSVWGSTFIKKSKAGNLIIFGAQLFVKGVKKGMAKTGIVPLFILKSSVTIKTKIAVEDLQRFTGEQVGREWIKLITDLGLQHA